MRITAAGGRFTYIIKILFGDIGRKRREVLLWTTGVLKGGVFTSRLRYWDFLL